jgi:hypothetical protein
MTFSFCQFAKDYYLGDVAFVAKYETTSTVIPRVAGRITEKDAACFVHPTFDVRVEPWRLGWFVFARDSGYEMFFAERGGKHWMFVFTDVVSAAEAMAVVLCSVIGLYPEGDVDAFMASRGDRA